MKSRVTLEVNDFFSSGTFPSDWNFTHLCLLPKIDDPIFMSDLRPISLCSFLYKIISKIMVSRLKPLMADIVSPTQSAFVEERLITDNILIAHEVIHALKTNEQMSSGFMAIKPDMSKAFDRVEWGYLRALLRALGFEENWIEKIMFCVSTVRYATLINEIPYGPILPERGLRQGDPMSPFLFVLCTEGLIHLMHKAVENGSIHGIQFSEEGPMIHHMLFADDCLLICKASSEQANKLIEILQIYESATGQLINVAKSAITFGVKVKDNIKAEIKQITGIEKEGGTGSYLGLPECFSGSKTEILAYIYDRLRDRLSGWFAKLLSLGERKSLSKQWQWQCLYFKSTDFLSAKNGPRPSYAWRSIQFGKDLLRQGLRKHIGNGETVSDLIDLQNNCWNMEKLQELFYQEDIDRIMSMKTAFGEEDYWVWVHNKNGSYSVKSGYWFINNLCRREEIREAESRPSLNDLKADIWKLQTAPKIKSFFWRAVSNAIPVGEILVKRGIKMDPCCQDCGAQRESINHILFQCSIARQVWALANVPHPQNGFDEVSHFSNFHTLLVMMKNKNISEEVRNAIPWIVWYLWKYRNGIIFEAKKVSASDLVVKVLEEAEFWLLAQKNEQQREKEEHEAGMVVIKSWSVPPRGWLKGNIGVEWNRVQARSGAAWVIRDDKGKVLLHSRRAFSNICSLDEAKYQALLWSVESFHFHHLNKIIIALDDSTFPSVVLRPKAWPSFRCQYIEIMKRLEKFEWWRLQKEERSSNRGAFFIAQSVIKGGYAQSYVAAGAPFWLLHLFQYEECLSSMGLAS
ncbi:uncharacterized protein LOC125578099 [Brassica napus]|uniref:uncharacterized protein LOC125578099 n=1 Tax=Brassica napus TaxID=3708 RepID=UPI0020784C1D|nr:uncharacterized protein LOC125578099 [Brassica napus]